METKKRMQRFLSIFLACIMILNVPMSALAYEDVMILDAVEDQEVYAEQEEAADVAITEESQPVETDESEIQIIDMEEIDVSDIELYSANSENDSFVDAIPEITTQPVAVTCGKDENATLSVAATAPEGANLTYQWYEISGENDILIEGATAASYNVPTGEVGEKSYYCMVTNTVNALTYTARSDTAKVTVQDRQNEDSVVKDIQIKIQNEDILKGFFDRKTADYYGLTMTDIGAGYKIYLTLSEEILEKGNVFYEIYYNGKLGTGRGDTGVINVGTPFQFNGSEMATGNECEVTLKVGLKEDNKFTTFEAYTFHITYVRGLGTLKILENNKQVQYPSTPASEANTYLNEFTGNIAVGTETVAVQIKPSSTVATAYIGETAFTTKSYKANISLKDYISEDGKTANIPLRLEWPVTDESLGKRTREYKLTLRFVEYTPEITTQPVAVTCGKDENVTLSVAATAPDGANLTYQWYEVSGENDTLIEGATAASYNVPTGEVGEKSYYCMVTNTVNALTYKTKSASAKVAVYTWGVNPPKIVTQPHDIICKTNEVVTLSVEIKYPESGSVTFNWFEGDNQISAASDAIYKPDTSSEGMRNYHCQVAWRYDSKTYFFDTATVKVIVDDNWTGSNYTPIIVQQPISVTCEKNDTQTLSVAAQATTDGNITYQWYRQANKMPVIGATSEEFIPSTERAISTWYYCVVTNTVNGERYSIQSDAACVNVNLTWINELQSVKDFGSYYKENRKADEISDYRTEYDAGVVPNRLFLQFLQGDSSKVDFTLSIYHNITTDFETATLIETAKVVKNKTYSATNGSIYEYYVDLSESYPVGTHYFFCLITASAKENSSVQDVTLLSGPVKIVFKASELEFDGNGSEKAPYLIKSADDYVKLQQLVAEGNSFSGVYFCMTDDITLPADWKPIGSTKDGNTNIQAGANLNAFSGIIDGNSKKLTIPAGGLPLLGYVNGAVVKNLNIKGEQIEGAGLVNNYTGVGLSGNAVTIENVRLLSGSKTLKSGFVASVGGNGYACASADFTVTIRNCTIEKDVIVGYTGDKSQIGSFAGRINGIVENSTSAATVKGASYVGGIISGRDNAMSQCEVKNCTFSGTVESSGAYAGGIVGGGYDNATAPNGACPTITGCTVTGTVKGNECVGGIFGGDGYVAQTWENVSSSISNNRFTGTISGSQYVGGIIGYRNSLNKYDKISANYYSADCGAANGIGFVKYLDTSYPNPTKMEDTIVINTGNGTSGLPEIEGCGWQADHNRTDDPLGVHAKKLATTNPNPEPEIINLVVSGNYKDQYYAGEKFDTTGMTVTAEWSNDKTTDVKLENLTIDDSAMNKVGWPNVKITYQDITVSVTVRVLNSIKVTFSLLGDSKHDSDKDGNVHTLADANLEIWVPETVYYVSPDATVYDILLKAAEQCGFVMIGDRKNDYGTMYIEGIKWTYPDDSTIILSELDNGPKSGWMDVVNGLHPNVGVERQTLKNNDVIVFHYTDDYTVEENRLFDQSQADEIADLVTALPSADKLSISDKAAVQAARAAYEALSATQKELVSAETLKQLEAAEARIAELEKNAHVHSWDAGTVTKAPTCTATGVKTYKCACGESKTETIPALGHKFGARTTVSEATVKAAEVQKHTCSVCGVSETQNVGSKLTPVLQIPGKLSSFNMKKGKTASFKVTMANGDSVTSVKSSKTKVLKATLDQKTGKITLKALKTGTAKLTIKLDSKTSKTYTVKVVTGTVKTTGVSVTSIKNKKLTLKAGKTHTLKTEVKPFTTTQKLTYKSSDKKVATVTSKGKIEAVAPGKATITVKSGSKSVKITVTVPGITIAKSSVTVKKNKTTILKPNAYGISGKITYTSSNPKVATVTSKGKVKGIKKGSAKITIKAGTYTKTVTVKVK